MRACEWTAAAYFVYLIIVAWLLQLPVLRRARVSLVGATASSLVVAFSRPAPSPALIVIRDWFPAVYILVGYWLTGLLRKAQRSRRATTGPARPGTV